MRKPVALTVREKFTAEKFRNMLPEAGTQVTIEYAKRDETSAVLAGTLVEVKGSDDKEVVVVDTEKGIRSANLYRVSHVKF